MTRTDMTQQLIEACRSLIAVLDEESTALSEVRFDRVAELREEKESAATQYESMVHNFNKNADLLTHSNPALRRELTALKEALDSAALRNINALRASLEMNRRLVQTIAASVDRQRITAAGYTKTGSVYSRAQAVKNGEAVPVSLNETF